MNLFLYGPSASGKSTTGALLASTLHIKVFDLDAEIEMVTGEKIPEIFQTEGEASFRKIEKDILFHLIHDEPDSLIVLGGGTLLDEDNRFQTEKAGTVICLRADKEILAERLANDPNKRPLLRENLITDLDHLLQKRKSHYDSFPRQLDTSFLHPDECVHEIEIMLGIFPIRGMGSNYSVRVQPGGLTFLGQMMHELELGGPIALVCDSHTAPIYAEKTSRSLNQAGYRVQIIQIPVGEQHKTIDTVGSLWQGFLEANLDRSSTVVALGGGVTGDLAGFAAATYLRGIPWVNVPTSLLAMIDSSLGGKTGADLPQGKNLIGAFYAPRLVLADPDVLATLPEKEVRNGLAETIKHGVIADRALYSLCQQADLKAIPGNLMLIQRSIGVKARVIVSDPYEKNMRQTLNFGHTVGHGVEKASNYSLAHGEAVAIGMVAETRLAEKIGLAKPGLAEEIAATLCKYDLPTKVPVELRREQILAAMQYDKKKTQGELHFALPQEIGKVKPGIVVEAWQELLEL